MKRSWASVIFAAAVTVLAGPAYSATQVINPFILTQVQKDKLLADWPQLGRYRADNAALLSENSGKRVVFMGDSITDIWRGQDFFPGKHYLNRGIIGQTTGQMLARFQADVISLKPRVVIILGGTNDIADNTGPSWLQMIQNNVISMVELARLNGIRVVLSSVTPVNDIYFPMSKGHPKEKILAVNSWMHGYARLNHLEYVDYYDALVDPDQALKAEYSPDGIHMNSAGLAVMSPLAQRAIDRALEDSDQEAGLPGGPAGRSSCGCAKATHAPAAH